MHLQESGEMYLETILILTQKSSNVRSIDVCEEMGFSKPSVSRAIGLLKSGGYVEVDRDGYLSLTELGREVAMKVYDRHTILKGGRIDLDHTVKAPGAQERAVDITEIIAGRHHKHTAVILRTVIYYDYFSNQINSRLIFDGI